MRRRERRTTLDTRMPARRRFCQRRAEATTPTLLPIPKRPDPYLLGEDWREALTAYEADALKPLPGLVNASHEIAEGRSETFGELEQVEIRGVGLAACDFPDLFDAQTPIRDIIKGEPLVGHEGLHGLAERGVISAEGFGLSFRWHVPQHYASLMDCVNRNIGYHGCRQSSEPHFPIFSMSKTNPDQQELARLGRSIRQIRNDNGLSVADLVAASTLDLTTLEAIEAGQLDPPYDLLLALAHGLGVDPAVIFVRAEQSSHTDGEGVGR
jgi:hypothetical protein